MDSFNEVYNQLPTLVPQLLEHTDNIDTANQRVSDNAGAIMVGYLTLIVGITFHMEIRNFYQ